MVEGVPKDIFHKTIIEPVRQIVDRGGKAWRSFGLLACIDIVGGDSRRYVRWLSMAEFMHVGSLIIDDIQDKSLTRRGGPCCHILHGEELAINAGTACYFMFKRVLDCPWLSDTVLNEVTDLYFAALRAGHAGQALDIQGLDYIIDEAVQSGRDSTKLEKRSLAIHRLKTGAPCEMLARMGAIVGGGSDEQIEAIGEYFAAIGLAFQIMDDVLNLRGLFTDSADRVANIKLKTIGEDIMTGKITMPVCKAMDGRLNLQERTELWGIIKSKPQDAETVAEAIEILEQCGALDDCVAQAEEIVESSWAQLDKLTPDTFSKLMLRSFAGYVIYR
jgi:geranylgeranyl pyrophosphate synthase